MALRYRKCLPKSSLQRRWRSSTKRRLTRITIGNTTTAGIRRAARDRRRGKSEAALQRAVYILPAKVRCPCAVPEAGADTANPAIEIDAEILPAPRAKAAEGDIGDADTEGAEMAKLTITTTKKTGLATRPKSRQRKLAKVTKMGAVVEENPTWKVKSPPAVEGGDAKRNHAMVEVVTEETAITNRNLPAEVIGETDEETAVTVAITNPIFEVHRK